MKIARIVRSAIKELGKNRLRSVLMMLGVAIGIAALTVVTAAGLGARERVEERVKKFGYETIMIFAGAGRESGQASSGMPATTLVLEDVTALREEIPAVHGTAPFYRSPDISVVYEGRYASGVVFGITPSWAEVWRWDVTDGTFIEEEDVARLARVALLGQTIRGELFGEANPIGEIIQVGNIPFTVKGVMASKGISPGGGDMDNRIFVPLSTMSRRVANVDFLSGIRVTLEPSADVSKTAENIRALLRERHRLAAGEPDDFTLVLPTEITAVAEQVAGTFNLFLILLASISLLVGGIVVANIMLVAVHERRQEIGLRRAVGGSKADVQNQFMIEALVVTVMGGLCGMVLGLAGTMLYARVSSDPVVFSWEVVAVGVLFSIMVGTFAGLYPARRAAALEPIEALRS